MAAVFHFDRRKALEALLYVAERQPDVYWALKALFYADKKHLEQYGRSVSGDTYIAMSHGPVPSGAYDMVKMARGDYSFQADTMVLASLSVELYTLKPKRGPDLDYLSISDRECLDLGIAEVAGLSFGRLKAKSHNEPAYKKAEQNDVMSLEVLVRSLPDGDQVWRYMADC